MNLFWRSRRWICAIAGMCLAAVLTGGLLWERGQVVNARYAEVQEGIAQNVLRLHILADSDREEDQHVKLLVRDAVLEYMGHLKEPQFENAAEAGAWASTHLDDLEAVADQVLEKEGFSYRASAEVTRCRFPDRQYADLTFPKGEYEALRIRLGRAGGHNWWCVLYPNLCYIDTVCAEVSDEADGEKEKSETGVREEGQEQLRRALTEEEYEMITDGEKLKLRWFLFDW